MTTPFENGFYSFLNPTQQEHAQIADSLEDRASNILDHNPKSEYSAALITDANKQRKAAGLVKGELQL